jgi:hypothetical protein
MREVAGSTPSLDFYLLCEPCFVCVSFRLWILLRIYFFPDRQSFESLNFLPRHLSTQTGINISCTKWVV